ncbi:MAG TPA: DUF6089 family protein [Flavilitoribacter sp.]|nr:DUF6089 family protein [Flavilitoribacter sp.]
MKRSFLLAILLFPLAVFAQKLELGVMGGGAIYSGDISPDEFGVYFNQINPAFGIFGRLNVAKPLSIRLGITNGKVDGDDMEIGLEQRGLNFRTNIFEVALTAEINVAHAGNEKGTQWVPYLFGGGAVYHFDPQAKFDGDYVNLQPLGTEGQGLPGYEAPYKLTQFAVPMGVGMRFIFKNAWSLGFEFGGRKLFTDFLDDVSSKEVNYLDILEGNGTLAAQLSNPKIKDTPDANLTYVRGGEYQDWYYFGGGTISFYLGGGGAGWGSGKGIGCPTNF